MSDKEKIIIQSLDYLIEHYKNKEESKQLEQIKIDFVKENENKFLSWKEV